MPFVLFSPCRFLDMFSSVPVVDDFVIRLPKFAQSFPSSCVQHVKKIRCSKVGKQLQTYHQFFYVLLTVHVSMILVIKQLSVQNLVL